MPHPRLRQLSQSCAVMPQTYLEEFREEIGVKRSDKSVAYTALNKDSHVLEVPESLGRKIPTTYTACAGKKGFRRYTSEDLQELAAGHAKTCQGLEAAQLSILSSITKSAFGEKRDMWLQVCSLVQAACDGALSLFKWVSATIQSQSHLDSMDAASGAFPEGNLHLLRTR